MTATDATAPWSDRFRDFERGPTSSDPEWLRGLRASALDAFRAAGFPHTKLEEWRYTSVARVASQEFETATAAGDAVSRSELEALAFPLFACSLFVFVDGHYEESLSTPRALSGDLHVESLARLRREDPERLRSLGALASVKDHAFRALNTAFLDDGAVIDVPAGQAVQQPIHLVFASTPGATPRATHPRVLIRAEPGSHATVIQDHVELGEGVRLTNSVTEVSIGKNAALDLAVLQRECDTSLHFSSVAAHLERDARLGSHVVTLGGDLVRNDLAVVLAGEGAECTLNGLFLGTGARHVDNHTLVDHAMPQGTSHQVYKGVLGGTSRGVFRGRVIVRPDAQKTNARQSNPNLLLSPRAEIDTKPQLEIHADDVKCSHGSTIGQLDANALFYLRSRGIGEDRARELLTRGFANEITRALPSEALAERIQELLLERLQGEFHPGDGM